MAHSNTHARWHTITHVKGPLTLTTQHSPSTKALGALVARLTSLRPLEDGANASEGQVGALTSQALQAPLTWESLVSFGSFGASVTHSPRGPSVAHESLLTLGPCNEDMTVRTNAQNRVCSPLLKACPFMWTLLPFSPGRPTTPGWPWSPGSPTHPFCPGNPAAPTLPSSPLIPGSAFGPGGPGGPR